MRLLLDTHVAIWSLYGGQTLKQTALDALRSPGARPIISLATVWEAAIKQSLQRRDFSVPKSFLEDVAAAGIEVLPVTIAHAWAVRELAEVHGDPFDRMIISQARAGGLPLVTRDRTFQRYGVSVIPA